MKKPNFDKIKQLYNDKKEQFDLFCFLLKEYNRRYNLTSILDDEGILYKHFYDSLAGIEYFPENATVCEVGSGGGFPSIPLKIVREDLKFTLIESTGKKCEFLRTVIKELRLEEIEVLNSRAEEAAHNVKYRERYDVSCARAVARLNTLSEYCLPFVKKGGFFLAYKGEAEEEIAEAKKASSLLGGGEIQSCAFGLFDYGTRSIIKIVKEKNTPDRYPRGNGKERTKPL